MAIIQDAISSMMGGGSSVRWQDQLRQASFRGVPFAVKDEEATHGRRQAIHDYPYRDTAWIEDMGRGTRRIIVRGFIVQDSLVYGGGDVISQRRALIEACETAGAGTLIHPTLGEMTVSIPEGGLRIGGTDEGGRTFDFTLTALESGLKVFAVTGSELAAGKVKTNYMKLVSTTVLSTIARVKSEIRGVTQAINTIKGTIVFWTNMVESTVSEVTNVSNTLKSTFGNTRYGRYNKGNVGGSSSGATGTKKENDTEDTQLLVQQKMAQAVMERKGINDRLTALDNSATVDDFVQRTSDVVTAIINSTGGVDERIRALEKLANSLSTTYQQSAADRQIAATVNTLIIVLCSGAMASVASEANPSSSNEANLITNSVVAQLDRALVVTGDRGDDALYNALLGLRSIFLLSMDGIANNLSDLMQYQTAKPIPALTLANQLYQDASRADELIQSTQVPHPAFMPTKMQVLRK